MAHIDLSQMVKCLPQINNLTLEVPSHFSLLIAPLESYDTYESSDRDIVTDT